jgi:hypothetical protein
MKLFGQADAMDVVEKGLQLRGWKYDRVAPDMIKTGVHSQSGRNYSIIIVHEADKRTLVFLYNPMRPLEDIPQAVAQGRLPVMQVHTEKGQTASQVAGVCEILLQENYRIVLGAFERDARDGELRFRIALPYRDTEPTPVQVNWCIDIAIGTLDQVSDRVERFLSGQLDLAAALGTPGGPMVV